jgi:hypothetical protein
LTHALRTVYAAAIPAFELAAAAPRSQGASLMNLVDLQSSFCYTLMLDESLERIIAKPMLNSDLD